MTGLRMGQTKPGPVRLALVASVSSAALTVAGLAAAPPIPEWDMCTTFDPDTGEPSLDAHCFFDVLVQRYRRLATYKDTVRVLQVTTERDGANRRQVETQIGCAVDHGRLLVRTPGSTLRRQLGFDFSPRTTDAMREAALKYNIWLAPHMALKFAPAPTKDFRSGVDDGFTATGARHVKVGDKSMVRLQLTSGDGQSVDPEAKFDLYINPDSMLVERIEGQQRMPDGATYETTLNITPLEAEAEETIGEPELPAEPTLEPKASAIELPRGLPARPPVGLSSGTD